MIRNLDPTERTQRLAHLLLAPVLWARVRFLERLGRRDADRRNIGAHYDLGNEFFSLFLDETMTYSCALFDSPGTSLADAQLAKLDRLCRKLQLEPSDHVLEIGSGWGSFAIHAARAYGCRVTTTTLSARQFEFATEAVARAGLADRVTVLLRDYRDLEGTYDKLVSIEMIEAVDWRQYPTFFSACARLLAPGGLMALQAITIADRYFERARQSRDFIKRYIFPGGCLPSVAAILETTATASPTSSSWPSTTSGRTTPRRCAAGGRLSRPTPTGWPPSASTRRSTCSSTSTSATARPRSWSGASPTSSACSPGRPGGSRAPLPRRASRAPLGQTRTTRDLYAGVGGRTPRATRKGASPHPTSQEKSTSALRPCHADAGRRGGSCAEPSPKVSTATPQLFVLSSLSPGCATTVPQVGWRRPRDRLAGAPLTKPPSPDTGHRYSTPGGFNPR